MSTNNGTDRRQQRYAIVLTHYAGVPTERFLENPPPTADRRYCLLERSTIDNSLFISLHHERYQAAEHHLGQEAREDWQIEELIDLDTGRRWDAHYRVHWVRLPDQAQSARSVSDHHALDQVAHLLRARGWPSPSAMKDIRQVVAWTGRDLTGDSPITSEPH